tara:strand:- start:14847 stop:15416 length:570 start_codon:yes stop_codon:yes gene_type:complete
MDFLSPYRARDDLHGTTAVLAPLADQNFVHPAAPCRKKGSMPAEKSVFGEGSRVVAGRVQHHFDNAIDISVCRDKAADVHAELPGDGGADLLSYQRLALNLAGFDDLFRQGLQVRFIAQIEPHSFHFSQQAALLARNPGEQAGQGVVIPGEYGPAFSAPDIHFISALYADNMVAILRRVKSKVRFDCGE